MMSSSFPPQVLIAAPFLTRLHENPESYPTLLAQGIGYLLGERFAFF
jgi:hypothetical protein